MSKSNILSTKKIGRAGLVDAVASHVNDIADKPITKKEAGIYIDAVFDTIKKLVEDGTSVSVKDFGVFNKRQRNQRTIINPNNGEKIVIPYSKFKVGDQSNLLEKTGDFLMNMFFDYVDEYGF